MWRCGTAMAFTLLTASVLSMALAQPSAKPHGHGPVMEISPWASLAPAMGSAEARLGMRAVADPPERAVPGDENILVIGRRRAPTEAEILRQEPRTAESWQSDAAQPAVPRLGESCSYKSGCFDPGQKSLRSMLFGDN